MRQMLRARDRYTDWQERFEAALIAYVALDDFISAVASPDIRIARSATYLVRKYSLLEPVRLIDLIAHRADDIVLVNQGMDALAELPAEQRSEYYRAAAESHFGSAASMRSTVIAALDDPHSLVRSIASQFLTQAGFDLRAWYREVLSEPQRSSIKRLRICLTALASLRNPDDLPFVKSFLNSETVMIRLGAYAAWFKLAEQDRDQIAEMALRDDAPRIIKFSLELVRKRGAFLPLTLIQTRLLARQHVPLLMQYTVYFKWDHLESIARLAMTCSPREREALQLNTYLLDWCGRCRRGWYETTKPAQFAFLSSPDTVQVLQSLLPRGQDIAAYLRQELIG
jgi:hypothetical protein